MHKQRAREPEWKSLRLICGNKGRRKPDVGEGKRNLKGEHSGNKSAETRGGPALIPKNKPVRAEREIRAETGNDPRRSGERRKGSRSVVIYPGKKGASPDGTGPCGDSREMLPCAEPPALPCTSTAEPHSSNYQSLRSISPPKLDFMLRTISSRTTL